MSGHTSSAARLKLGTEWECLTLNGMDKNAVQALMALTDTNALKRQGFVPMEKWGQRSLVSPRLHRHMRR